MAGRADAEAPGRGRLNSLPTVTKAELESKHLAELHALAAEVGVERYRMLPREELIEKLLEGRDGSERSSGARREPSRRSRRGSEERTRKPAAERERGGERKREPREDREKTREPRRRQPKAEPRPESAERQPERAAPQGEPAAAEPAVGAAAARSKRKRRRRRWGRRRKTVRVQDLLLPATPGRQAIVYAESRVSCTSLLRELAAQLSEASDGADPIALLVDPSPEELADWRREAPRVEIVAASQARHAGDAVAQATLRASGGESVIVLIDSLSRFAESFGDADEARELFDAGRGSAAAGSGSLTVVAAVERPQ